MLSWTCPVDNRAAVEGEKGTYPTILDASYLGEGFLLYSTTSDDAQKRTPDRREQNAFHLHDIGNHTRSRLFERPSKDPGRHAGYVLSAQKFVIGGKI
jgi:hypothetical protein